jgi:hypothetical protein
MRFFLTAMRFFLTAILLIVLVNTAYALPYFCAGRGYYTNDRELCSKLCNERECEEVSPDNRTSRNPCDTNNYDSFIYDKDMNRTLAISKTPIGAINNNIISSLAVINDSHTWIAAGLITEIRNVSVLLGFIEKPLDGFSYPFNTVNPNRFISAKGDMLRNFEPYPFYDTEPNNAYPGEPYITMDATSRWSDTAFTPNAYYELRQWSGPLECVAGIANPEKVELLDETRRGLCSDDADCFACFTSEDEETLLDDIRRCDAGALHHDTGNSYLCADGRKSCTPPGNTCAELGASELTTEKGAYCAVEPDISCPVGGGTYSTGTNKCDLVNDSRCDPGYTFNETTKECRLTPVCNTNPNTAQAVFNPTNDSCIAENVYNCPSGYTLNGNICETTNIKCLSSEYAYDAVNKGCKSTRAICPAPLIYNQTTVKCEMIPTCPTGTVFNATNNKCVKSTANSYQCKESTGAVISSHSTINSCNSECKTVKDISPVVNTSQLQNGKCVTKSAGLKVTYECWYDDELANTYTTKNACTSGCKKIVPVQIYPFQIILTTTINQHSFMAWCVNQIGKRQNTHNFGINDTYVNWYDECGTYWDQSGWIARRANGVEYYNDTSRSGTKYYARDVIYPNLSCVGICSNGLTYNAQTNACEADAVKFCAAGVYNPVTHKCETSDQYFAMSYTYTLNNYSYTEPICTDGAIFDKISGKCKFSLYEAATSSYRVFASNSIILAASEKIFAPCETGYTYNYNAKTCVKSGICFNQNGSVNTATGLCLSKNQLSCPKDYNVIKEGLCQAPPNVECGMDFVLDNGSYNTAMNTVNGLCMRKDNSAPVCPIDENMQCVDTAGNGEYYCSPHECFDFDNSIETTETQEGENDLANDGDPNKCEFLMSNGKDSRCRMRGADTLWHNCCAFDTAEANAYRKEDRDAGLIFQRDYLSNPLDGYIKTEKFWDYAITAVWNSSGLNLSMAAMNAAETITKFVGLGCTERDLATAEKVSSDQPICQKIGDYCISSLFKKCIQRKATYCCYSSMFDLAFAKAARNSIEGFNFGDSKSPNCRGITIDEFKKIDWNDEVVKSAFNAVIEYYAKDIAKSLDNDTLNAVMDDVRNRLIIEWETQ